MLCIVALSVALPFIRDALVSLRTIHLSQKLAGILEYVLLGSETYCCLLL